MHANTTPRWTRRQGLRDTGTRAHCLRVYTRGLDAYPRLTLVLHREPEGVSIRCSVKRTPRSWWDEAPIPVDLLPDLREMLAGIEGQVPRDSNP
jgi:hypothetical protein